MTCQPCHLITQEQFASHHGLTLEVVRTLEYGPERRLWLLRCTECGQAYLKGYEQLKDWADGEGQVRQVGQSLALAWQMVRERPYILWDDHGRLRWLR